MTTVFSGGFAAAVRHQPSPGLTGADPHAVTPVSGTVAATAFELESQNRVSSYNRYNTITWLPPCFLPCHLFSFPNVMFPMALTEFSKVVLTILSLSLSLSLSLTSCWSLSTALVMWSWFGCWYFWTMVSLKLSFSSAFNCGIKKRLHSNTYTHTYSSKHFEDEDGGLVG